jgi:sulfonate transport system substrate-binding protein
MVAKSQGWFEEAFKASGVQKVDYKTFQELAALNESLGAQQIDMAFEAEPPAIVGRAAGIDLRIVGISCSLDQEILVRAKSPITSVADLRGKKVTVPSGTSSHYNLLAILAAGGVPDTAVQIIDMSPPDARNAFDTGQVDAWAIWPPWVEQQIVAGTGRVLPGGQAKIHSIMSTRGAFEDQHREIVQAAFTVLERSKAWILQNPEAAQKIVAQSLNLDQKVIALAWPKHDWHAQLTPTISADIQKKADFLKQRGLIKTAVSTNDLIVPLSAPQQ